MAAGDAHQHGSVAASVVTLTMPAGTGSVRIINMTGTAQLAVTVNGVAPALTGNNKVLPATVGAAVVLDMEGGGTAVRLISDATGTAFSVWVAG